MYIVRNENGLRDKIIRMIAGEHISINTKTFQNDMCTFETADDILSLLVHLGYLTYDFDTKTAWIPNQEVRQEFLNSIERMPDAFVCASDYVACILMQLLEKRGLRVPEDVAVSGFDNNIEDLLAENLTTVQVFNEELGSRLALQILYRIKYPHTPHEVTYLESKVLYRASTGD